MNRIMLSLLAGACVIAIPLAVRADAGIPAPKILTFDNMAGVDGAFVGDANPIRGIPGDELPWEVDKFIQGRLFSNGRLLVQVRGLVFADDESVPADLRGRNDEEAFRAVVSCLTDDGSGHVATVNATTDGFPATPTGNASIDATLELPHPCIAPVVFILAGSEDKWFAVTGAEGEGG